MLGERVGRARAVQGPLDAGGGQGDADGQVLAAAPAGSSRPLTFTRDGAGTLFYTTRLRYAADELFQQGLDNGIRIERVVRALRRERHPSGGDVVQGGRSDSGHADAAAHQGAPLRRRHRSAAGRIRAARVVVRHHGPRDRHQPSQIRTIAESSWESLVAARRVRSRRAPRRSRPAVRDPARRGPPPLHLRRARHDRRHVPDRAGARRGDVRAGGLRPDADGGDHGAAMKGTLDLPAKAGSQRAVARSSVVASGFSRKAATGSLAALRGVALAAIWLRCGPLPAGLLDAAAVHVDDRRRSQRHAAV